MAVCLYRYVTGHAKQRWLLSAHARTIPRFLGFSYFSQNKQIWAAEIDNLNFEGGLSFNRSSVSQVKGINIKKKLNVKTEKHVSSSLRYFFGR